MTSKQIDYCIELAHTLTLLFLIAFFNRAFVSGQISFSPLFIRPVIKSQIIGLYFI